MIDPHEVLHCPMQDDNAGKTIGQYLGTLLVTLWVEKDGFSGKRPLGNSGWDWEVYEALVQNGFIAGTLNDRGYLEDLPYDQEQKANELIMAAIHFAYDHGTN